MDRITKERRSWNMSQIRSKDTVPEIIVRKYLYAQGVRYRLHVKLPGKPDVVIRKKRIAIFINGCFWHAHDNCPNFRFPKARSEFWKTKIESNISRDEKNNQTLINDGWKVITIWECQLRKDRDTTLTKLMEAINR